jgi:tetratricopeptide (TPR) repeat protein
VALHRAGRRDEALEQFQKVVEQNPETRYLVELGAAYASLQRMDDSEATFKRALESAPGHPGALYHLGNLAQRRGETTEAISLYGQAIQGRPDYLMAHFQLAEALRQAGQLEPAYRGYERVVSLDPKAPPELEAFDSALLQLANIDLQMGATERAVQFLQVLVEATPEHPTAHLLLGQALSKLGRQEDAKQQLAIHQRIATRQDAAP